MMVRKFCGFPSMGVPQNVRFRRQHPVQMDDCGYLYFRRPPCETQYLIRYLALVAGRQVMMIIVVVTITRLMIMIETCNKTNNIYIYIYTIYTSIHTQMKYSITSSRWFNHQVVLFLIVVLWAPPCTHRSQCPLERCQAQIQC